MNRMMYDSPPAVTYCLNRVRVRMDGVVGVPVICQTPTENVRECMCKSCKNDPNRIIDRQKPHPADAS